MTQKRILRAISPKVTRERGLRLRDAFRLSWKDPDAPEVGDLLDQLATDDPQDTAAVLFDIANRLIDELTEATGVTREQALHQATSA